ncbi:hypothetical protein C8R45DRAFT_1068349 [Mycena sanguinolenta]|nr:hypothetical protein C8R45DRAFT_1068349 [Mycena sanguinolenta]
MSRRSARLSKTLVDDPLNSSDHDKVRDVEEDKEENQVAPKKKRRKHVVREDQKIKNLRGRRGILSSFREFPLDIVVEIFSYLNPMDLLNLARATKEIRTILMSPSSAFMWKKSRSHIEGLPDLPRDLSEPQYANLCFSTHCHECLAVPFSKIIWSARMRLCNKCIYRKFGTHRWVAGRVKLESSFLWWYLVPSHRESGNRRELFSIDEARKLSEECEAFLEEDGQLQVSNPDYQAWFTQKRNAMKEIDAHARSCASWEDTRLYERTKELRDARRLREEAIVERLTALGWGEEVLHDYEFFCHRLVNQPKKLTDRIWKNIEGPLVEFLTDLKERREHVKMVKMRQLLAARVYDQFREASAPDVLLPPKIDVLLTEPFRVVIEDTPIEETLTEESFAAAISSVAEFSVDWQRRKEKELVKIMRKNHPDAVEADLHLATTFFSCSTYFTELLGFPTILVHPSPTQFDDQWEEEDTVDLQHTLQEQAWNADGRVRLQERAQRNARAVVEACGLDPDVTTGAEMDEINPALECLNCRTDRGSLVMRWTGAVRFPPLLRVDWTGQTKFQALHICGVPGIPSNLWRCLDVDEERLLEKKELQLLETCRRRGCCCRVCGDSRRLPLHTLKHHFRTEHGISSKILENIVYPLKVGPEDRFPPPKYTCSFHTFCVESEGSGWDGILGAATAGSSLRMRRGWASAGMDNVDSGGPVEPNERIAIRGDPRATACDPYWTPKAQFTLEELETVICATYITEYTFSFHTFCVESEGSGWDGILGAATAGSSLRMRRGWASAGMDNVDSGGEEEILELRRYDARFTPDVESAADDVQSQLEEIETVIICATPLRSTSYPTTLFFSEDFVVSAGCVLVRRNPNANDNPSTNSNPSTNDDPSTNTNPGPAERGRLEICVLHDRKTDEWLLPKGRKDTGESIAAAAVRETFEETGYPCALLPLRMPTRAPAPGVNTADAVSLQSGISEPLVVAIRDMRTGGRGIKIVWWFVARATGGERVLGTQTEWEAFDAVWLAAEDACADGRLTYESDREVVRKAVQVLQMDDNAEGV